MSETPKSNVDGEKRGIDLAAALIYLRTGMLPDDLEDYLTPKQKHDPELVKFVQEHKEGRHTSRS